MKFYRLVFFIAIAFHSISPTWGQKTKRQIYFAEIPNGRHDTVNVGFDRHPINIPYIVLTEAIKEKTPLYYFTSFDKNPTPLTYDGLIKNLIIVEGVEYPAWDSKKQYTELDIVNYNGIDYECAEGNVNSKPDSNEKIWRKTYKGSPVMTQYNTLSTLGLDYLIIGPNKDRRLQYVHFYYSDYEGNNKYVVSLEANHVIDLLNRSGRVWYKDPLGFLNHLTGEIFLLNNEDNEKITKDLKQIVKVNKTKVSEGQYNILVSYNQSKIDQFFLFEYEGEAFDTIPKFDLGKYVIQKQTKFYLLGDALANSKNWEFSDKQKMIETKVLTRGPEPVIITERPISKIVCNVKESFYVDKEFYKQIYSIQFFQNLGSLVSMIYPAASNSYLNAYKSDSLLYYYNSKELEQEWTKKPSQTYSDWSASGEYYRGDHVAYNNWVYTALTENSNKRPDISSKDWSGKKISPELYQPSDVGQIDIIYQLTFTDTGAILSKVPISIEFLAFNSDFGLFKSLGYFNYKDLLTYTSLQNPELGQFLKSWIENQDGLFMIKESGPLMTVESANKR